MADQGQIQFSEATLKEYHEVVGRYPTRQAALLPTLWMAQREFGWISHEVEEYVARLMELPPAHVRGVVSFYTMFYQQPVGRWHLEVCTNLSCRLRGAEQIVDCIKATPRPRCRRNQRRRKIYPRPTPNAWRRAEPPRCFSSTMTATTKTSPRNHHSTDRRADQPWRLTFNRRYQSDRRSC